MLACYFYICVQLYTQYMYFIYNAVRTHPTLPHMQAVSVNELYGVCMCDSDALEFINMTSPANVSLCSLLPM